MAAGLGGVLREAARLLNSLEVLADSSLRFWAMGPVKEKVSIFVRCGGESHYGTSLSVAWVGKSKHTGRELLVGGGGV